MIRYYDRQGCVMPREKYVAAFDDPNYHRVALDTFPDGTHVSTVWLGLDHNLGGGRPLIFETCIFGPYAGDVEFQWRYSTEERARAAHRRIVDAVIDGDDPWDLEL